MIFLNTHLIKYKTKKLKRVTLSTCSAETLALLASIRATKGLLLLLEEAGVIINKIQFYCDNKATIDVIKRQRSTPIISELSTHELKLRQDFREGRFSLSYVKSEDNIADIFTKNLGNPLFGKHRAMMLVQT